jgi:hypothetical protein
VRRAAALVWATRIAEDRPVRSPVHRLAALALTLPLPMMACVRGDSASATTSPAAADPCADFEVQVEKYWSASIRAQVLGKGGEIELDKRSGVVTKLDRISEDWVMMRTSVCKDHYVRSLIAKDEYAARVRCFDDRLERQRTLATALTGDGELAEIEGAIDLLLAAPASCDAALTTTSANED